MILFKVVHAAVPRLEKENGAIKVSVCVSLGDILIGQNCSLAPVD